MEAQAILDMLITCPYIRNFIAHWIFSDDGSSMCEVLCHVRLLFYSKKDPKDKVLLQSHIIEPEFKDDPSHRKQIFSTVFLNAETVFSNKIQDDQ